MTTTMCLARDARLSYQDMAEGWRAYVHCGNYPAEQENLLVAALCAAQQEEFEGLLPDGCWWQPHTCEVFGPQGSLFHVRLGTLMGGAVDKVMDRYNDIETATLGEETPS